MTIDITNDTDGPMFWIAHGPEVESGRLDVGGRLSTGRDYLETYPSPRQWNARLIALRTDYPKALAEWQRVLRLRDPLAHLADYRWRRETGGMELPDGTNILTTREAQAQITSTVLSLSIGLVTPPVRWKAESGWVSLGVEEMGLLVAAVALHVKVCFMAEEAVQGQLENEPTLDVEQAFEAAYDDLMSTEMAELVEGVSE